MEPDLFERKATVAKKYGVKPHTIAYFDKAFIGAIASYKFMLEGLGFNTEGMSYRDIHTIVEDIITEIHG